MRTINTCFKQAVDQLAYEIEEVTININLLAVKGSIQLMDLNEDCLISVCRQLSLEDLNSIGLTCHRLHEIVNINYKYQPKLQYLEAVQMADLHSNGDSIDQYGIVYTSEYLIRFGKYIRFIAINNSDEIDIPTEFVNEIFSSIVTSCSELLKSLEIRKVDLDPEFISNIDDMFNRLTKLDINCESNWTKILSKCTNIETLIMKYKLDDIPLKLNFVFPQLKIFEIQFTYHSEDEKALQSNHLPSLTRFIGRHTKLVKLSLRLTVAENFNLAIIGHLKELEKFLLLDLDLNDQFNIQNPLSLEPLYKLKKIKTISMNYYPTSFIQLLTKSNIVESLEVLQIHYCTIDQSFILGLRRFHKLRDLTLWVTKIDNELADDIWSQLPELNSVTELLMAVSPYLPDSSPMLFINSFINNRRLKILKIIGGVFNAQMLNELSKLENLEELRLHFNVIDDEHFGNQIDWQSFKRLNHLKILWVQIRNSQNKNLSLFLDNLGSHDTLREISFKQASVSDEIFKSISKFQNLNDIYICFDTINGMMDKSHFNMVRYFKHLKYLKYLYFGCKDYYIIDGSRENSASTDPESILTNILHLVKICPVLEHLNVRAPRFNIDLEEDENIHEKIVVNGEFYDKLVDIVKNRHENHHLTIDFVPKRGKIPHHSTGKQFVQLRHFREDE